MEEDTTHKKDVIRSDAVIGRRHWRTLVGRYHILLIGWLRKLEVVGIGTRFEGSQLSSPAGSFFEDSIGGLSGWKDDFISSKVWEALCYRAIHFIMNN